MANRLVAFTLLVAATLLSGCTTLTTDRHLFQLGETRIQVRVTQNRSATPTMVNVHDDENTSVRAGRVVVRESGGRLIELVHSGKRFVEFQLEGDAYRFDPNRIFTEEGIRATLTRQKNYSDAAHAVVRKFAQELLETFELNRQPVIIALHNTGNGGLSINSYQPAQALDRAADRVHETKSRNAGDFFYVTDERFFAWLKERDFNVMLQDNANVPDDGSMSVYFGRRGIPYLNIEANNHHLEEQIEMVRAAERMLAELKILPSPGPQQQPSRTRCSRQRSVARDRVLPLPATIRWFRWPEFGSS
ncbi:MAG TPA: hypothetical protein VFZ59_20090 [Verrucomicrobiae bacterium]|nr:hypothetical protein [Verrucomicrobiae bacterium]